MQHVYYVGTYNEDSVLSTVWIYDNQIYTYVGTIDAHASINKLWLTSDAVQNNKQVQGSARIQQN